MFDTGKETVYLSITISHYCFCVSSASSSINSLLSLGFCGCRCSSMKKGDCGIGRSTSLLSMCSSIKNSSINSIRSLGSSVKNSSIDSLLSLAFCGCRRCSMKKGDYGIGRRASLLGCRHCSMKKSDCGIGRSASLRSLGSSIKNSSIGNLLSMAYCGCRRSSTKKGDYGIGRSASLLSLSFCGCWCSSIKNSSIDNLLFLGFCGCRRSVVNRCSVEVCSLCVRNIDDRKSSDLVCMRRTVPLVGRIHAHSVPDDRFFPLVGSSKHYL